MFIFTTLLYSKNIFAGTEECLFVIAVYKKISIQNALRIDFLKFVWTNAKDGLFFQSFLNTK